MIYFNQAFLNTMNYQKLSYLFPFSISIENNLAAFIFVTLLLLFLGLIIWAIIKKLSGNEILKYEFITIIAHKFRTPLTQVKWISEELLKSEQDPYKHQSLQDIEQSNEKLIKLTNTLIELTDSDNNSASTYAFEKVMLCEFVRTVSNSLKNSFHEKNIFFSVQCPPNDTQVKIDPQRMEFVLQTLLENALTYTTPGQNVDVIIQKENRKVIIAITDHGIGIDKRDLPHVFTKFFRAQNAQATDTEGFGVGLYLAQSVVRRHKGNINVYSEGIGTGSTFVITLPTTK